MQLAIGRRVQTAHTGHRFPVGGSLDGAQGRVGTFEIGVHLDCQPLQLFLQQDQVLGEGELHFQLLISEVPIGESERHQTLEYRHLGQHIAADLPLQPSGFLLTPDALSSTPFDYPDWTLEITADGVNGISFGSSLTLLFTREQFLVAGRWPVP